MDHTRIAPPNRIGGLVLLSLAITSGSMLMIPFLNAGPLMLDEHCSYWLLDAGIPSTLLDRSLQYAAIPPLSAWVQWILIQIGGKSELMLRLSSAIPFILAIAVVFQVERELGGDVAGGLAAIMLAWHPEAMEEVRVARCYGLMLLLSALSFWVTVRWLRSPGHWGYAIGWSLCGASLLWVQYVTVPVIASQLLTILGVIIVESTKSRPKMMPFLTSLIIIACLGTPLIPSVIRLAEWSRIMSFGQQPVQIWSLQGPLWLIAFPVGLVITRIMSATLFTQRQEVQTSSRWVITVFLWGLLPLILIAMATHCGFAGLNSPRYRVAFAVPGVMCLATVLARQNQSWASVVGTLSLLLTAWCFQSNHPWELTRVVGADRQEWCMIAHQIDHEGKEDEPIFVQSGLVETGLVPAFFRDQIFMDYVSCRIGKFYMTSRHPRLAVPLIWTASPEMVRFFEDTIHQHARQQHRIWVVGATDTDLGRKSIGRIESLLKKCGYRISHGKDLSATRLVCYEIDRADMK